MFKITIENDTYKITMSKVEKSGRLICSIDKNGWTIFYGMSNIVTLHTVIDLLLQDKSIDDLIN